MSFTRPRTVRTPRRRRSSPTRNRPRRRRRRDRGPLRPAAPDRPAHRVAGRGACPRPHLCAREVDAEGSPRAHRGRRAPLHVPRAVHRTRRRGAAALLRREPLRRGRGLRGAAAGQPAGGLSGRTAGDPHAPGRVARGGLAPARHRLRLHDVRARSRLPHRRPRAAAHAGRAQRFKGPAPPAGRGFIPAPRRRRPHAGTSSTDAALRDHGSRSARRRPLESYAPSRHASCCHAKGASLYAGRRRTCAWSSRAGQVGVGDRSPARASIPARGFRRCGRVSRRPDRHRPAIVGKRPCDPGDASEVRFDLAGRPMTYAKGTVEGAEVPTPC